MCKMNTEFINLPADVFFYIFQLLDQKSLLATRICCSTLKQHVDEWLKFQCKDMILVNFHHENLKQRSCHLTTIDKYRVVHNWLKGKYSIKSVSFESKCMPWLQHIENKIWISSNNTLQCFDRKRRKIQEFSSPSILTKFVCRNKLIFAADTSGSISQWNIDNKKLINIKIDTDSINALDVVGSILCYGTNRGTFGICSIKYRDIVKCFENNICHRIWCVALKNKRLAVGSLGAKEKTSLNIYDIEVNNIIRNIECKNKTAVLAVKWEDANTLYSSGNDSYINKWDIRIPQYPVQKWADPIQEAVYSLETDSAYTIVSGAQYYGRIVLWDNRQSRPIQIYFLEKNNKTIKSPVYSLSFDASHVFATTDRDWFTLNFETKKSKSNDYSSYLSRLRIFT